MKVIALNIRRESTCNRKQPKMNRIVTMNDLQLKATEMNRTKAKTMDDLPELPFEKVLSYLNLEDRLKARAVSRRWYHKINSFRVKSLCYAGYSIGNVMGKSRWVSGAFARNFISSIKFDSFFNTFGQSILSNLKHLRLHYLDLNEEDGTRFDKVLNSFNQLEELVIIAATYTGTKLKLNLPMLKSIHLEGFFGFNRLTLDTPRLQQVTIFRSPTTTPIHVESVERLIIDHLDSWCYVNSLMNLKQLYVMSDHPSIHPMLLSGLDQLNEIHLVDPKKVAILFDQKRRYGRADLKIYFYGLRLNGRDDPAIRSLSWSKPEYFVQLTENQSRLAHEFPFDGDLYYSAIERVAPQLAIDVLKRFASLGTVIVDRPVQDIERFLGFLKSFNNIKKLEFLDHQPQDLFDRLPEHSAVQTLGICYLPPDFSIRVSLSTQARDRSPSARFSGHRIGSKNFRRARIRCVLAFPCGQEGCAYRNPQEKAFCPAHDRRIF